MSAPGHFQESIQPLWEVIYVLGQALDSLSGLHFDAGCFRAIGTIRRKPNATIQGPASVLRRQVRRRFEKIGCVL
jgi:hypothetical protein